MPDDTISAASAPSNAASPASEAAPAPQEQAEKTSAGNPTFEEALDAVGLMTDAQISAFESGDFSSLGLPAKPVAPSPEESDQDADQQQPASRRQAALEAKTPEELAAAGAGLGRISIKDLTPEDRARTVKALDLIRAGKTPAAAFADVFGIAAQPAADHAAAEQPNEPAEAAPAVSQTIADLESQLGQLQQQYKEAKEAFDPAATDILEQMTDLKMDLREARRDAAVVDQAWTQKQSESHARAKQTFSELLDDPNSKFAEFCDDEIILAQNKKDPILSQPDWPEKIGQRVMDKFFKDRAAQSAESPKKDVPNPIPPVPRQSVRLPGSPVGGGFAAGQLSPQVAEAEIDKLTPEQQDALIRQLDTLTTAQRR